MNNQQTKEYALSKPRAMEDFPFGQDVSVFKVKGKMFALLGSDDGVGRINLKCEPLEAQGLRDIFEAVIPGYHMNKKHWNTVILNGTVPESEIIRMIDSSYRLVIEGLKKSDLKALQLEYTPKQLNGR